MRSGSSRASTADVISFEMDGSFDAFLFCHCSRCRKETGSAHGANLFSKHGSFRWLEGVAKLDVYPW